MEKGLLDVAPLWSDLKTFPYGKFHGLVDILIAGYPCQPFSAAGKRAGKDDPRHLWPWIADGIRVLRPRTCFLENVEGHISLGLSTVVSDLEELGYKVSWGIFSASECGAPHQRKRVFILAHRIGEGLERFLPSARIDQEGWEIPGGSAARCGELRGDWERVVFAA
jgi:DNA (cytosine-5)-methyltransferase 1